MYIPNKPEDSYWECEWLFPRTGTRVSIGIPGNENGPDPKAREFFLALPDRFERTIDACRPKLKDVFSAWLQQELPQDIFSVVTLAGFGLEDPSGSPIECNVAFETTCDKWLGITIPFVGEIAQEAGVDT